VVRASGAGADGVILETNSRGVYLGDERLEPLYAELDRRSAILFVHPTSPCGTDLSFGYPKPMLEFMFESTRSITHLVLSGMLDRYPRMRVVVPHAGAASAIFATRVDGMVGLVSGGGEHPPPSLRQALRTLHFDLAGAPVPELLSTLLQVTDPRNLHYGSDFPFTPAFVRTYLADLIDTTTLLDDRTRQDVLTANSRALLSRSA
jgi:6-methylsalicylate decarboxylase